MKEETKQKLCELARFLKNLPKQKFNWWIWARDTNTMNGKERIDIKYAEEHCGTQACVAGWTCLNAGYVVKQGACYTATGTRPVGSVADVAQRLLKLSDREASALFYPNPYAIHDDPKSVANYIDKFVKTHEEGAE